MNEPFMPVATITDEQLVDTGDEVITWAEYKRRDRLKSSILNLKNLVTVLEELKEEGLLDQILFSEPAKRMRKFLNE